MIKPRKSIHYFQIGSKRTRKLMEVPSSKPLYRSQLMVRYGLPSCALQSISRP